MPAPTPAPHVLGDNSNPYWLPQSDYTTALRFTRHSTPLDSTPALRRALSGRLSGRNAHTRNV